jgi:hypothetical protein
MRRRKKRSVPTLEVPENATLRQIYAAARKAFTAADLQKFTEKDSGVPMEKVLADMERIHLHERKKSKPG